MVPPINTILPSASTVAVCPIRATGAPPFPSGFQVLEFTSNSNILLSETLPYSPPQMYNFLVFGFIAHGKLSLRGEGALTVLGVRHVFVVTSNAARSGPP